MAANVAVNYAFTEIGLVLVTETRGMFGKQAAFMDAFRGAETATPGNGGTAMRSLTELQSAIGCAR